MKVSIKTMYSVYLKHITSNSTDCVLFAAPVQVKELTFSSGIAAHDLTTKLKQVESWLERKHHVRITLRAGRGEPAVNLVRKNTPILCHSYPNSKEMTGNERIYVMR